MPTQPKLNLTYPTITTTKAILKTNPEISADSVKGYDRRVRGSPFIMEHVKIIEKLTNENERLKAENEKLKAKNEHEKEAVREYHKLHVADTYICGNGICKGKTYEEAKRIIIDKEGYEYWELWRKRVTWGLV